MPVCVHSCRPSSPLARRAKHVTQVKPCTTDIHLQIETKTCAQREITITTITTMVPRTTRELSRRRRRLASGATAIVCGWLATPWLGCGPSTQVRYKQCKITRLTRPRTYNHLLRLIIQPTEYSDLPNQLSGNLYLYICQYEDK